VIERVNGTLHPIFAKLVATNHRNCCELTAAVTYAYNTAIHSSTTFTPFYLMFMRHPKTPIELLVEKPSAAAHEDQIDYVQQIAEQLRSAFTIVRSQLGHISASKEKI